MTIRQQLEYIESQLGIPAESCIALQKINEARLNLWNKGDWTDTYDFIHMRVSSGKFYLPWWAKSVKKAWECCAEIAMGERCWEYADPQTSKGSEVVITSTGQKVSIPYDIPLRAQLGFAATDSNDKGKSVRLSVFTPGGTRGSETITLAGLNEPIKAELDVAKVTGLSKDKTYGCVEVYMYDDCGEKLIYTIDPTEIVSESSVYCVKTCKSKCILLKVKKKHFPYSEYNLDASADLPVTAIQYMIEAFNVKQDIAQYKALLGFAIAELNAEKSDVLPAKPAIKAGLHVDILG